MDDQRVRQRLDRLHDDGCGERGVPSPDPRMPATPVGDADRWPSRCSISTSPPAHSARRERRLLEQHAMQRRIVRVQHHHRAHEAFHDVAQVGVRRRQHLRRRPHQERLGGRHVLFEQRDEERVLAREYS